MMTESEYLHHMINTIRVEYEKAIKPYVERLVYIKRLESPPPILLSIEEWNTIKFTEEK